MRRNLLSRGVLPLLALAAAGCAAADPDGAPAATADGLPDCPVAEILAATDAYMETFNARDIDAWEATYHFPHVRIASGAVSVLDAPGTRSNELFERLAATGWDHSGWAKREVIHCEDDKAHLDTTFVRYGVDGAELARFNSLYVMEQKDGRWGVTARSSFAP